ncbi:hypothetical protein [Streptomyces sp. NBC_01439]|uniref:hypothetical protein n=1 Tax=Streptomyces sp. NBC_01439 TaxID=2903867 RepID=UPI00069BCBE8|nr:hypothetical protein [Streptomyces sp. NBC_01439]
MKLPLCVPVRLALAAGAAEVRLRQLFPRIMWALTPSSPERDEPFAEMQRIESDPEYRALFLAGLDAAIVQNAEAAVDELRNAIRPDTEERAA